MEGYAGNIATGIVAAINLARQLDGKSTWIPPQTTMIGALCHYITHAEAKHFQPMKANFGIMLPLDDGKRRGKRDRAKAYAARAIQSLQAWLDENNP